MYGDNILLFILEFVISQPEDIKEEITSESLSLPNILVGGIDIPAVLIGQSELDSNIGELLNMKS